MKSLVDSTLSFLSFYLAKDKSGDVPKWENLCGDVLGVIFGKLTTMDVVLGASRDCTSWRLASKNRSLWMTVDLASHEKPFFYNPRVNAMKPAIHRMFFFNAYVHRDLLPVKQVIKNLKLENLLTEITNVELINPLKRQERVKDGQNNLDDLLIEITKLSCTAPTNLFFDFYSYIQDKELVLAAERMPNVEKLVLPMWCSLSDNSFRFAFSQWKNLRTMVIVKNPLNTGELELQVVGENCKNLTNLKFVGLLDQQLADQIVLHLQVLKRLSLRCSFLYAQALSRLVDGLQNLEILNISHSRIIDLFPMFYFRELNTADHASLMATQKLHRLIMCPLSCCHICKDRLVYGRGQMSELY